MATFYFNGAVDSDWATLGNWWTSDAFTTQAAALPASGDSVVVTGNIDTNSGSEPTVVNLTCTSPEYASGRISIAVTVTGNATFNGESRIFAATRAPSTTGSKKKKRFSSGPFAWARTAKSR
jgi:hypothetical protein